MREPGGTDVEHTWYVQADDLDLGNADPFALRIGHFYDRHPEYRTDDGDYDEVWDEARTLAGVEELTRGAHLIGCVPNFDAEVLGARMRAHGIPPGWHYHLIDVETLAVGYLRGLMTYNEPRNDLQELLHVTPMRLPWDSEALSRALGVEPPGEDVRHTAIGDARWVRDMFDAVMAGRSVETSAG